MSDTGIGATTTRQASRDFNIVNTGHRSVLPHVEVGDQPAGRFRDVQPRLRADGVVHDDPTGLSGADIEAILARALLASDAAGAAHDHAVSLETLRHAFADFIPATSPLERELQILVAVQECTSREVLPGSYRSMERSDVQERITELRRLLIS